MWLTLAAAFAATSWPAHGDTKPSTSVVKAARDDRTTLAKPSHTKDAPFVIVAFGSSSTQGVGASSPAFAYPAQAEHLFVRTFGSHPAVVVLNRGVGGENIDDMTKRLRRDVISRSPDLVVWQAGSNDILRGIPLTRFVDELRAGVAAIRTAGAEVILIEPQWCPAFAGRRAQTLVMVNAMRAFAAAEHVPLVRRYDLMQEWVDKGLISRSDLIGRDGLHMTDHGYELLAKAVFEQVRGTSKRFRATVAGLGSTHM